MFQNILLFYANFCGASTCYGKAPQIFANFSKMFKYLKEIPEMLLELKRRKRNREGPSCE